MITYFTIPKAFVGRTGRIQRNAIQSWRGSHPDAEIVLYGDDEGVAETAAALGTVHVGAIVRNNSGTPLLDGVFADAQRRARFDVLCFVNADIVLLADFAPAIARVVEKGRPFLVIGETWDTEIPGEIGVDMGIADVSNHGGRKRGPGAIDYFAFTRGLFEELPPFAVGRIAFDNWLVWQARTKGALVVDATRCVHAVHQEHEYAHADGGFAATRYHSEEGQRNLALAGGKGHLYTRFDATHVLTPRGIRRNHGAVFRAKERGRKALYRLRRHTAWPAD